MIHFVDFFKRRIVVPDGFGCGRLSRISQPELLYGGVSDAAALGDGIFFAAILSLEYAAPQCHLLFVSIHLVGSCGLVIG